MFWSFLTSLSVPPVYRPPCFMSALTNSSRLVQWRLRLAGYFVLPIMGKPRAFWVGALGVHSQDMAKHGPPLVFHSLEQRRTFAYFVESLVRNQTVGPAMFCNSSYLFPVQESRRLRFAVVTDQLLQLYNMMDTQLGIVKAQAGFQRDLSTTAPDRAPIKNGIRFCWGCSVIERLKCCNEGSPELFCFSTFFPAALQPSVTVCFWFLREIYE